jgi:hypothetical protein
MGIENIGEKLIDEIKKRGKAEAIHEMSEFGKWGKGVQEIDIPGRMSMFFRATHPDSDVICNAMRGNNLGVHAIKACVLVGNTVDTESDRTEEFDKAAGAVATYLNAAPEGVSYIAGICTDDYQCRQFWHNGNLFLVRGLAMLPT